MSPLLLAQNNLFNNDTDASDHLPVIVDFVLPITNQSWDCDGQGNCFDPGTGNGLYSSLSSCQSNCIVSSEIKET